MFLKKYLLICLLSFSATVLTQEEKKQDSLQIISENPKEAITTNCKIVQGHKKLKGRHFVSAQPLYLRTNKDTFSYGVFQFGRGGERLSLYVKLLEKSVCLRKEKNFDISFSTGEYITLEDQFSINCEGNFARKMSNKEIDEVVFKEITKIIIYIYHKNCEFLVNPKQDNEITNLIQCLRGHKQLN